MNAPTNSAVDQLATCLAALHDWEPHVKAMITIDGDGARRSAELADRAAAEGRSLGLLHGVPLVVKDNIDTADLRTTYGSRFFENHVPTADAEVIRRVRRAGAVIVGKATLHEFACGIRSCNSLIGQCRNPWDLDRIPGGSSGGSAVAIATGMAQMALGTDTGASVRIPAAFTGATGLRPTVGRVSNRGTFPLSPSLDTVGPMAGSVDEVARLFAVIAGFDPADAYSVERETGNFLPTLRDGISGVRIGRPRKHYFENVVDSVSAAMDEAIGTLVKLGAKVVDVDVPCAGDAQQAYSVIMISDACHLHAGRLAQGPAGWEPQTLERLRLGAGYSGADYASAMRKCERLRLAFSDVFRQVDILISPTCPVLPPLIDDERSLFAATKAISQNTVVGSLGGIPGLSLPCGLSPEGLPIGLQLEANRWGEALLLRAGCSYQMATDWHRRRPCPPSQQIPLAATQA